MLENKSVFKFSAKVNNIFDLRKQKDCYICYYNYSTRK